MNKKLTVLPDFVSDFQYVVWEFSDEREWREIFTQICDIKSDFALIMYMCVVIVMECMNLCCMKINLLLIFFFEERNARFFSIYHLDLNCIKFPHAGQFLRAWSAILLNRWIFPGFVWTPFIYFVANNTKTNKNFVVKLFEFVHFAI